MRDEQTEQNKVSTDVDCDWNIAGLPLHEAINKILDDKCILSIMGFTETWLSGQLWSNFYPHYTLFHSPAVKTKMTGRASDGLALFIINNWNPKLIYKDANRIFAEISPDTTRVVLIGIVYIPPTNMFQAILTKLYGVVDEWRKSVSRYFVNG